MIYRSQEAPRRGDAIAEWLARSRHNQKIHGSIPGRVDRGEGSENYSLYGEKLSLSVGQPAGWLGREKWTFDYEANSQISISAFLNNKT